MRATLLFVLTANMGIPLLVGMGLSQDALFECWNSVRPLQGMKTHFQWRTKSLSIPEPNHMTSLNYFVTHNNCDVGPISTSVNHWNESNNSYLWISTLVYDNKFWCMNGFYNNFFYCRFLWSNTFLCSGGFFGLSMSAAAFSTIGSCGETTMSLLLFLLVLVWQKQGILLLVLVWQQ